MKEFIKLILNIFDFFTQQKILKALEKKIDRKKIKIFIDIGSHKGEYISSLKSKFSVDKIFAFEPNPNVYEVLEKKFNDPKIKSFNLGISEKSGIINLNKNLESSSSSINNLNTNSRYYKRKYFFLNIFNLKKVTTKIDINVIRLDEFIKKNNIEKIDLLKIDTEGYEFKVLKSIGDKIRNIYMIHFEHHFDDMIIKNYNLSDIHNYLLKKGFIKYFKVKMAFRKSFEYIYVNENFN